MKKEKGKSTKGFLKKSITGVIAGALALTMAVGIMQPAVETYAMETAADANTIAKYTASLGDNASTEYAGRIWTDKSVWDDDSVTVEGYNGVQFTIQNDQDFLTAFSALATSEEIAGQTQAPVDVVFVIDMSGSMINNTMDNRQTRLYNATNALDDAVSTLLALNDYVRVGVVSYNRTAYTMLPLDHYEKIDNRAFFSCSGNTITINARGTKNTYNNTRISTQSGTNIQKGIHAGMSMLADVPESDTKVTINGVEFPRVPSVVLLTDGEPSCASDFTTWWNLSADNNAMSNRTPSAIYGMKALMTASYMKQEINRKYAASGAPAVKVYSIGMGITGVTSNYRPLAYATINPNDSTLKNNTNTMVNNMRNTWSRYANNQTATLNSYTFAHPNTGYDIVPADKDIDGLYYVDAYYDADDADAVTETFKDIVTNISISTAKVPTAHDPLKPMSSGYITYTDPIGEYMEVKDFKSIVYGGYEFKVHTSSTSGNKTTYTFTETTHGNAVYGEEELKHILIDVVTETDAKGIKKQTLTIQIPASLIPIRVNKVSLSSTGSVLTHTNNGATPIRIFYTVGLQDAVKKNVGTTLNPEYIVNTDVLSEAYVEKNSNADGTINFYSNLYSGNPCPYDEGDTIGDATAVFNAARNNPFYYVQEDALIYVKNNNTYVPATGDALEDGATYYYKEIYYHGLSVEETWIARTGKAMNQNTVVVKKSDGYWYRQAGTVRTNRMLEFAGHKGDENNHTKTASDFYAPTYDSATSQFKVYLGNNGLLTMKATGNLAISKGVTADAGLTAPDKEFAFTVRLTGEDNRALSGTYSYVVTDVSGEVVSSGTVANGDTLHLKADQTALIQGLPAHAKYTITETAAAGFATSVKTAGDAEFTEHKSVATGTITVGETATNTFLNHYSVTPVAVGDISGKKVLAGPRRWEEGVDTYTFRLIPYDASMPMPAESEITVTTATDNQAAFQFDFDSVEFTAPGKYRYMVVEMEPDNDAYIAGITYSRAVYRVVIDVQDGGNGTLAATTDIQRLYTDSADPLFTYDVNNNLVLNDGQEAQDEVVFTNTYNAESVTRVPVALKSYTDHSGMNPLKSGMFRFELKPLGVVSGGNVVADTAARVPMPKDASGNKLTSMITENEGANVTFLPVKFTQGDILPGEDTVTFRYQMREVFTDNATAANNYTWEGMTYDSKVYTIDVTVAFDATSHELDVNAVYPNGEPLITFVNEYNETPAVLTDEAETSIRGTKKLIGKAMQAGESYEFKLEAADEKTAQAVTAGDVILGKAKVNVSGAADSVETLFTFGQTTFRKQGVYVFKMSETVPAEATKNADGTYTYRGVTYDTHVCTVTVAVTDTNKDSILEADVAYSTAPNGSAFINTYRSTFDEKTAISLLGNKTLTGHPLEEGEFFYEVHVTKPDGTTESSLATNKLDGTITLLDKVTYDTAGKYTYVIKEQIPKAAADNGNKQNGITFDTTVYTVLVEVTDDYAGNLTAEIVSVNSAAYTNQVLGFTNVYTTENAIVKPIALKKELTGRAWKDTDVFKFRMSVVSADPADGVTLPETLVEVSKNNIPAEETLANVKFEDITFTKPGTYVIKVEEVAGDIPGITYSNNVIQSTFVVEDNGAGELVAKRSGTTGSYIFKNDYSATGKSTPIPVEKQLKQLLWAEDTTFAFVLAGHDDATRTAIENGKIILPATDDETRAIIEASGSVTTDLNNVAGITMKRSNASVSTGEGASLVTEAAKAFGEITFTETGNYLFHIREIAGDIEGLNYDTTSRLVAVKVEDAEGKGTLSVTVELPAAGVVFVNNYVPGEVILPGHGNLHVHKFLDGREWTDQDKFYFVLEAEDEYTKAAVEADKIQFSDTRIEINKGNKDFAHFGNITFTEASELEYVFAVKEDNTNSNPYQGVNYDTSKKIVKVKVSHNNTQDPLKVEILSGSDALTFTNTYTPNSVTVSGVTDLKVQKLLEGREWKTGETFSFALTPVSTDETGIIEKVDGADVNLSTAAAISKGYVTTGATTVTVSNSNVANFGDITFTKTGTYLFEVSEVIPADRAGGLSYDNHVETVVITVTDDGCGQLVADVVGTSGGALRIFTNIYHAESTTAVVAVEKTLAGREFLNTDGFEFLIRANAETPDAPLPENTRLHLAGDKDKTGNVLKGAFGEITYTSVGTYKYKVSEVGLASEKIPGVINDATVWDVTVTVTDNGNGNLVATVTYEKALDASYTAYDKVIFENSYEAEDGTYATANLGIKKVLVGKTLAAGQFQFALEANPAAAGMTLPSVIATNRADGSVDFGTITFTEKGNYKVKVTEVPGTISGVTYDSHEYVVEFEVTDDYASGQLKVAVESTTGSKEFKNVYTAKDTAIDVALTKDFARREWKAEDAFTFVVEAEDTATIAAVADGKVQILTPNLEIAFSDVKAENVSGTGTEIHTVVTKTFDDVIKFKEAGNYQFHIREVAGADDAITYDATKRVITVVVEDNGLGNLVVRRVEGLNTLTFINEFNPDEAVLYGHGVLDVTKEFTGREWKDGEVFTFKIKPAETYSNVKIEEGKDVVTIGENTAEVHFGNIIFTEENEAKSAEGTYKFIVEEVLPEGAKAENDYIYEGIKYDFSKKQVTVVVTYDSAAGVYHTRVDANQSDELKFKNTYGTTSTTLKVSDYVTVEKQLAGRDWNDADAFEFVLREADAATEAAVAAGDVKLPTPSEITISKATKDHKDSFGEIVFTKPGSYKFVIEEVAGSDSKINYSTHKIYINVKVTDNGAGSLETDATPTSIVGNNIPFVNTYTPDAIEVPIVGVKSITGREFLETDVFWFKISAEDLAPLPAVTEVSTNKNAAGRFDFGTIRYNKEGTYVYVIEEVVKESIAGVTYDSNEVIMTVDVTYNPAIGQFQKTVSYSKGGEIKDNISFVNAYTPNSTTITLSASKKVIDTANGNYVMNAGDFAFRVVRGKENPAGDPIAEGVVTNEEDGTIFLSDTKSDQFTYSVPGTYIYQIFEASKNAVDCFKYDESAYTVVVEVTEDQAKATLDAKVTVTKDNSEVDVISDGIVFTNVYDPEHAHFIIEGTKKLTGADFDDVAEFEFKLEAVTQGAPMPETGGEIATSGVGGTFRFGQIEYDTAGEYKYKITEVLPDNVITNSDGTKSLNGVTYDTAEYYVTVKVEDKASAPDNTGLMLSPSPVACTVSTGCTLAEGHSGACDTACKETVGCVLINGHTEECLVPCGLTTGCTLAEGHSEACDTACKETIGCVLTNGHTEECFVPCGKTVDCILSDGHGEECQIPALLMFMNPEKGVCEVTAGCTLEEGHEGECDNLSTEENNEPETTDEVLVNNEGASLKTVIRNLFMVATGTLGENNPTPNNLSSPNYGQLHASISEITKGGTVVSEVKFENKYHSKPVSVTIGVDSEVKKAMSGRQLKDKEFEFELKAVTSGAPTVGNAKNDAAGKVQFDSITFTETGTYSYVLKEVLPPGAGADPETGKVMLKGVTYDQKEYAVRVVVSEAKDSNGKNTGNLVAHVEYLDGGQSVEEIEFQNIYSVQPTTVEITANKVLNGRNLNASEFEFKIAAQDNAPLPKDANGVDIVTVKNDADGFVKFGTITFTTAGEYKYTIEEVNGTLSRVTYDTAKYDVVINVVDNGEGTFIVDVKYYKGGNEVNVIEFVNTYKEPPKPKDPEPEDDPKDEPEIYPAPPQPTVSTVAPTGDSANLAGLFGLLGAAVIGFFGIKTYKRKKQ